MKQISILRRYAALLVIVITLAAMTVACTRQSPPKPAGAMLEAAEDHPPAAQSAQAVPNPQSGKAEVTIGNFTFNPKVITVTKGTTVKWTNRDDIPHVVASADDKFQKSQALDTDQSFSYTFTEPGTYNYFCAIHPKMTGTVIVQ